MPLLKAEQSLYFKVDTRVGAKGQGNSEVDKKARMPMKQLSKAPPKACAILPWTPAAHSSCRWACQHLGLLLSASCDEGKACNWKSQQCPAA